MFCWFQENIGPKLRLAIVSALLLIAYLGLNGCQQEPCLGNKEVYAGLEIRFRDTIRTNIVSQVVSLDLSKSFGILVGRNRQYLLPLNPATDTTQFILNLTTGQQLKVNLSGQKTMNLLSERCGFVYNFSQLTLNGSGFDSSLLVNSAADTSRKTNFVLWVR